MKKLLLSAFTVMCVGFAHAQDSNFKAGIHLGIPVGDLGDAYSFNAGVDLAYMWTISDKFKIGIASGYSHYIGKTLEVIAGPIGLKINVPSFGFIPVAGSAQYSVNENLFLGADLGYAIYSGERGGEGGIYYQPKFGYQADKFETYLGYRGISSEGESIGSVVLGFNYKF